MVTTWYMGNKKNDFPDMVQFSLKSKLTHCRTHPFRPEFFFFASHEAKLSMKKKRGFFFFAQASCDLTFGAEVSTVASLILICIWKNKNAQNTKYYNHLLSS